MNVKRKQKKNVNDKKYDLQNQIIQRKNNEIESLKSKISKLEIDCETKDELINSIESLRLELKEIVVDLDTIRNEYNTLVSDLMQMRKVFNQEVFHGRWRVIKWLMK